MPTIKITELDLTTAGNNAAPTDVVYIPGFVDTEQESLSENGMYIGLQPNVPTLITSMSQFKSLCGTRGARFDKNQLYTDLIESQPDGTYSGFDKNAVPYNRTMFVKDTVDPSYVMAKELIQAGLSVVYERVNKDADYVEVKEKPADWENSFHSYRIKTDVYAPMNSNTPPALFTPLYIGDKAPEDVAETETSPAIEYKFYELKINDDSEQEFIEISKADCVSGNGDITKTCFARATNAVEFYDFKPVTETILPEFEADKFYSLDTAYITTKTNFNEAEIVYQKDENGNFNKVTKTADGPEFQKETFYTISAEKLESEPTNWADPGIAYYQLDGESYNVVNFNVTPEFKTNTFYAYDYNIDAYTLLTEEPDDFNPENYYIADVIPTIWKDKDGKFIVPTSFAKNFNSYCEKTFRITSLENVNTAPSFEDSTIYEYTDFININTMYDALADVYNKDRENGLGDMGTVSIKYLTSGGYPTYEYNNNAIVTAMLTLAEHRGDCVAFIDHTDNANRTTNINSPNSVYKAVLTDDSLRARGEFGTMFTPYMNHNRITSDSDESDVSSITMSATFSYLLALADSIKTNANWLAIAGAARGVVPNLQKVGCTTPITNGAADAMQPRDSVAVNAITNIAPYGYTIWGNRTLKNNGEKGNITATSCLNIRNLISDVKKLCYKTCKQFTFEPNNDILWVNIKSKLQPTLDRMVSGYGISGYKIVRDTEHEKAIEKATLCFKVIMYPVFAVEDFYITVVLTDDEVTVE